MGLSYSLWVKRICTNIIVADKDLIQGKTLTSKMKIFVKLPTGKTIQVEVDASDDIDKVKQIVQVKEGMPPQQQVLNSNGRLLEGGWSLSKYNIQNESTLEVKLRD